VGLYRGYGGEKKKPVRGRMTEVSERQVKKRSQESREKKLQLVLSRNGHSWSTEPFGREPTAARNIVQF